MSIVIPDPVPASQPDDTLGAALAHLAQVTADGKDLAKAAATGTDLVPASGTASAVATRTQLAAARSALTVQQAKIVAAQDAVRAELDKQMADALVALEPMAELVKRMEEGIWTVNLYLGREEEIVTLRGQDFEPASADAALVVRQMVLYMDEESLVGVDYGGLDARSIGQFDEWLLADPAHVNQVIPDERGVVALKPRRNNRDYKDPWMTATMSVANSATYFLIRNGDRLYRMTTDFNVGRTLVPARDEFLMPVTDRWGHPLEPGTPAWLEAEKAVSARERHYMRVALILQGLIDRTTVLQPLPAGGLSLLDPQAYDSGMVRLLDEAMTLPSGRLPFQKWQQAKLALLRPGMRVVLATNMLRSDREERSRLNPENASWPASDEIHRIERREGRDKFVVLFQRTDVVYSRDDCEGHVPTKRASFTFHGSERFVLPLDLITVAECEMYLAARGERHAYLDMVPALKTALAAKKAEQQEEAPVRDLIAAQIVLKHHAEHDQALAAADELVTWWKTANRWNRALSCDETRAINAIVAEFGHRAGADTSGNEAALVGDLLGRHRDALVVARKRDGSWVVLEPQPRRWPAAVSSQGNVFVRRTEYPKTGRGAAKVNDWWVVEPSVLGRWRVLHEGSAWATWKHGERAVDHLTDPEIEDLVAQVRSLPGNETVGALIGVAYGEYYNSVTWSLSSINAYFLPARSQVTFDTTHALTGGAPKLEVARIATRWRRVNGKAVLGVRAHASRSGPVFAGEEHVLGHLGMERVPWAELSGRDVPSPVWVDEQALAQFGEMVDEHTRVSQGRRVLAARAQEALASIRDAWVARAEALAYERFMQDFGDLSLWEGHRKTLKVNYPYSVQWNDGHNRDGLHRLVWLLVESGVDLDGLTVADALARWGQPVTKRGFMGTQEEMSVPDDVLALRFMCPAPRELTSGA